MLWLLEHNQISAISHFAHVQPEMTYVLNIFDLAD